MVINPYCQFDVFENYPRLNELFGDSPKAYGINWDKYIRFLALIYDPRSYMVQEHPTLKARKEKAAAELKFHLHYADEEQPRKIAIEFLKKIIHNRLWTLIVSNETAFDEFSEKVNMPLKDNEDDEALLKAVERKGKLLDYMGKIRTELDKLYAQFFGGDVELEVEGRDETFTPEYVGRLMKKMNA